MGCVIDAQLRRKVGACQESAIDNKRLPCHEGCAVRAHPDDSFHNFSWLPEPANGMKLNIATPIYRFEFGNDIVPHVPPGWNAQVGALRNRLNSPSLPCQLSTVMVLPLSAISFGL